MQGLHHETVEQALSVVEEALEKAKEDGKWMVAVWSMDGDKVHLQTRTMWNFPRGDIPICMKMFRDTMKEEDTPPPPLPPAKFIEMALKDNNEDVEGDDA